jgi:RNA polymerase sigma-70 factor (ECF subfamily)
MVQQPNDADLVMRIADGDTRAMGILYDRHARQLVALAAHILRNPDGAEDVVHDVFVALSARASTYSEARGTALAWLIVLTRNRCIDRQRATGRQRRILSLRVAEEASTGTPARSPCAGAESTRVDRALAGLTDVHRATLRLVYVEGLSMSEIAERGSLSVGTVKSRVARAMAELRTAIAEPLDLAG